MNSSVYSPGVAVSGQILTWINGCPTPARFPLFENDQAKPTVDAMNYMQQDETEDENLLICDIADEALEAAADTDGTAGNITWYYCPTGLTICRV